MNSSIQHSHSHCEDMTQLLHIYTSVQRSKLINFDFLINLHASQYTQNDSNVFTHTLRLIYITHTYIAKTQLSFCTFTRLYDAVNRSIFRLIRLIYMHRNHIHCKDTTQSLLIYTEQQQHLCAYAATNIQHSHSHCKDTTQLLHIYTSVQRSKLINFDFLINLHTSQIHKSKLI